MVIQLTKYELYTHTPKTANQNMISNKYSILIGQFWSTNTKRVFKSFMNVRRDD